MLRREGTSGSGHWSDSLVAGTGMKGGQSSQAHGRCSSKKTNGPSDYLVTDTKKANGPSDYLVTDTKTSHEVCAVEGKIETRMSSSSSVENSTIRGCRAVALMCVLAKWYGAVVVEALHETPEPIEWKELHV